MEFPRKEFANGLNPFALIRVFPKNPLWDRGFRLFLPKIPLAFQHSASIGELGDERLLAMNKLG